MKKHNSLFFVFIFLLLITACSKGKVEEVDLTDIKQVTIFDYRKSESIKNNLKMEMFKIKIPNGGQINSFCIYNNTVFYVVDFYNYFENPTGEKPHIDFEKKYNTQIRSFELENNEDLLLYQYDEEKCVQVTDMQCNGKELVWEDYIDVNSWNIKKMSLSENGVAENIFSYEPEKGIMTAITLTITDDGLFWYNQVGDGVYSIELCRYDFETKKVSIEKAGLSLSYPFEHINILDGIYTTYKTNLNNTTQIYIDNLKNKEELILNVAGNIRNPVSNGEICVWLVFDDYQDGESIFIYDIKGQTMEKVDVPYVLSYGLVGNLLLVNQEDGLYCYDVKNKEYENIIKTEIPFGYTFQGQQNNIYAYKPGEGLQIINIIYNQ